MLEANVDPLNLKGTVRCDLKRTGRMRHEVPLWAER
jgi:hypothetical protein